MGRVGLIKAGELVFGRMGGEAPTYGGHRAARWDAQGFYKLLGLPTERGSDSGEPRGVDMPVHLVQGQEYAVDHRQFLSEKENPASRAVMLY